MTHIELRSHDKLFVADQVSDSGWLVVCTDLQTGAEWTAELLHEELDAVVHSTIGINESEEHWDLARFAMAGCPDECNPLKQLA